MPLRIEPITTENSCSQYHETIVHPDFRIEVNAERIHGVFIRRPAAVHLQVLLKTGMGHDRSCHRLHPYIKIPILENFDSEL